MKPTQPPLLEYLTPAIDMHAHPPYDHSLIEPMFESARRVGIRRIILNALGYSGMIEYPSADEVERGNALVSDLIARYPGFVFGLVYVNPNLPETLEMLDAGLNRPGMRGIKLWVSCRDSQGRLNPVYPVLRFAADRDVPVLVHAFYRTSGNMKGELSPNDVAELAEAFPKTKIVMAHLGGQWVQGVRTIKPYPNVWSDISGSRAYLGSVEHAVKELGAARVLFGTDAFIRNPAAMLGKIAGADLGVADKRRIVWGNSAALFFREK
jgi:uncharacterized protein